MYAWISPRVVKASSSHKEQSSATAPKMTFPNYGRDLLETSLEDLMHDMSLAERTDQSRIQGLRRQINALEAQVQNCKAQLASLEEKAKDRQGHFMDAQAALGVLQGSKAKEHVQVQLPSPLYQAVINSLASVPLMLPAAARFVPPLPGNTPLDLFYHTSRDLWVNHLDYEPPLGNRLRRRASPREEILVYTDGSCLDQHLRANPSVRRAGCAALFETAVAGSSEPNGCWLRLEEQGPSGQIHPQTSNRAELRAAIAALEYPRRLEGEGWKMEGWHRVVVATDSSYVVNGITDWITSWQENNWTTSAGKPVMNRDLWERLLALVNRKDNVKASFWLIPRALNTSADKLAKAAAETLPPEPQYHGGHTNGTWL